MTPIELAAMLDHSVLKPEATAHDVLSGADTVRRWAIGFYCVQPCWVTLAAQSLLQGTSGILRRSRGRRANGRAGSWPRATRPAVEDGSREACAAMILRSFGAARDEFGRATRLVLTGGGAADVVSLLPKGVLHQPDLVLHGVQVAFGGA